MYRISIITLAAFVCIVAPGGYSDTVNAPATPDLDGSSYICFFDLPSGVAPAAESMTFPYYFTFNQSGNNVWGFITALEEEEFETPAFYLGITPLYNGYIKNRKLTISMPDGDDEQVLNFKIQKNGIMKATVLVENEKFPMVLYPLDKDDRISGIYIGKTTFPQAVAGSESGDNAVVGLMFDGTSVTACAATFNPDFPGQGIFNDSGKGTYNPETGEITNISSAFLTGSLNNGKLNLSGYGITGYGYYFGIETSKNPKLKGPVPKQIKSGKETVITMKYKYLYPGAHVGLLTNAKAPKIKNADIYIRKVEADEKSLTITVVTSGSASGTFTIVAGNADGNGTTSKPIAIK